MNKEVKNILSTIKINGKSLDTALLHFNGVSNIFAVYSPSGEGVGLAGDDRPLEFVERWDIDLYSKADFITVAKQIKQAFIEAGWCYKGAGVDTYDEATGLYHRLLEFEKESEVK